MTSTPHTLPAKGPSNESLVDALTTRLRYVDLVGWTQITARAEELGLSFEDLRLLLAITTRKGPSSVSELARLSGLPLAPAYPAIHILRRHGYLREERRRYSLTAAGQELSKRSTPLIEKGSRPTSKASMTATKSGSTRRSGRRCRELRARYQRRVPNRVPKSADMT